jgi:type 2A phosphatase activator TIP41
MMGDAGVDTNQRMVGEWRVEEISGPIATRQVVDEMTGRLGIPMPTMLFDRNQLILANQGISVWWRTEEALSGVSLNPPDFAVRGSKEWQESRMDHVEILERTISPFDWTFSSHYHGRIFYNGKECAAQQVGSDHTVVDYARLRDRAEPILYFKELILYEDELADNGLTRFSIKLRMMPTCWFALVRCFVRVEGVLFRVLDSRLYHRYGSGEVGLEKRVQECRFDSVEGTSEQLMDMDWVSANLPPTQQDQIENFLFTPIMDSA